MKGLRVLAMAFKEVKEVPQSRAECEQGLTSLGLLLLENNLKQDTKEVVDSLRKSDYNLKIISGDNPLTTINCGYSCGILNRDVTYYIDHWNDNFVIKEFLNGDRRKSESPGTTTLEVLHQLNWSESSSINYARMVDGNYDFGVTGSALQAIKDQHQLSEIIRSAKIFARMQPNQKTQIVAHLQKLGLSVAMVGDGANDCVCLMVISLRQP